MALLVKMIWDGRLGCRRDAAVGLALECVGIAVAIAGPYLLKLMVDQLSEGRDIPPLLPWAIAVFAITTGAASLTSSLRYRVTTRVVERISGHLTLKLLSSQLPTLAHEGDAQAGALLGRIERLPFNLQIIVSGILWEALPLAAQTCVSICIVLLFVPDYYAGLITILLGAYLATSLAGASRYRGLVAVTNERVAALSASIGDIVQNASKVVFNGNASAELAMVARLLHDRLQAADSGARSFVSMTAFQGTVLGLGIMLILGLAARDVSRGVLTSGDFVLLQSYVFRLTMPLGGFGFLLRQAGRAFAELREFVALPEAVEVATPAPDLKTGSGATVSVEGVSFHHAGGPMVLRDVNLSIPAGGLTAIVGPNGSGKSTLGRIIAGIYSPTLGHVSANGINLADIHPLHRHRHVLYVPQQTKMFCRTLRENGLYPHVERDVSRLVRLLDELRFSGEGAATDIDLVLGEQGKGISGGQAQKLEIARVAGIDVPIIILDESTSAMDAASEAEALTLLRREMADANIIIVSHRYDIARRADQVLFMVDGVLRFVGPHRALLAHAEYRSFWHMHGPPALETA